MLLSFFGAKVVISILIGTGFLIGLISSFFGIGGGVIAVPVLYFLFPDGSSQMVIATSLGMIFINAIINTINFWRQGKRPKIKVLVPIAFSISIGVIIGSLSTGSFSTETLKKIFALTLLFVAIKTFTSRKYKANNYEWKPVSRKRWMIPITLVAGFLSGITGVGGGVIMVPAFLSILKMPLRWIAVYSNVGMFFATGAGICTFMLQKPIACDVGIFTSYQIGQVNWGMILFLSLGASISSKLGTKLTDLVPAKVSKWLFGVLLLGMAIKLFTTT